MSFLFSRLGVFVLSLAFALGLLVYTLFEPTGFSQRRRLHDDVANRQKQNSQLNKQIEALQFQMQALQKRVDVQERIIRDELGYVHKEDMIIDLSVKK